MVSGRHEACCGYTPQKTGNPVQNQILRGLSDYWMLAQ